MLGEGIHIISGEKGPDMFWIPSRTFARKQELVGAHGTMVKVTAVDDYSSEIPLQDFLDSPVIFADMLNAKPMSLRDKGPLFVIYPFDIRPDFYNEAYFGKSVWQIKALEVH